MFQEHKNTTTHIHYIAGGDGLAAFYVQKEGQEGNYYFAFKDYLGSILTLTDKNGNVVQEQSFDAWGRYRNTEYWSYDNLNPPTLADGDLTWLRGYTGHEYLPQFSLIHMNGRLYDPYLGRMLSPDNFVHTDFGTQGYNRYSYAANNPLKYTDPSGEVLWVIPHIGYSKDGGFDIGVTAGIGLPGVMSGFVSFGHSTGSNNSYASVGGSLGGFSVSVGYGTQTGMIANAGFGIGIIPGVSTNITSAGVSWSQNGGFSINYAGLSINDGVASFNPSIAYSHYVHFSKEYEPTASLKDIPEVEIWATRNMPNPHSHLIALIMSVYYTKNYVSGEGNINPTEFRDIYEGKTEGQIMIGESTLLGYKYPNDMSNPNTRFVMLANGKEVDMIHFMVVGRAGHTLGIANEFQQFVRGKASGFNPQDLYSNKLGVNFFNNYDLKINQSPSQISNYIFQYLTNQNVLYPPPFQPQYEIGPKW